MNQDEINQPIVEVRIRTKSEYGIHSVWLDLRSIQAAKRGFSDHVPILVPGLDPDNPWAQLLPDGTPAEFIERWKKIRAAST